VKGGEGDIIKAIQSPPTKTKRTQKTLKKRKSNPTQITEESLSGWCRSRVADVGGGEKKEFVGEI